MVLGVLTRRNDQVKIVPITGKYIPQAGDCVVGVVQEMKHGGCIVDINSPYSAFLPTKFEYPFGTILFAKIIEVDEVRNVSLDEERKLIGGYLIEISPARVLRVIGKNNSMLNLLREKTKSMIFVGMNGRVWLRNGNAEKAERAIFEIEKEAHTSGLTEKMEKYLSA
jgi:exosome complex component RRP4